jgi:hypothetical protein
MAKTRRAFGVFVITVALVVGPAAFIALAKGRGSHGASASTLEVVMVDPTDPVANYGDLVTFVVATSETGRPFVQLSCFQGRDLVFSQSAGFFSGYPFTQSYGLWSVYWTGGAADCTAQLYYFTTNGRERVIATLDFPVAA